MFRGFPFYNVDFSITKSMTFKERVTAQFRAEFFNVFNHPNIANPFGGPGGSNAYTDPSADAGASFGFQPLRRTLSVPTRCSDRAARAPSNWA